MRTLTRLTVALLALGLWGAFGGCVIGPNDYRVPRGQICGTDAECDTGYCNVVCCNTSCDDTCEACTEGLTGVENGICAPLVLGDLDPDAPECDEKGGCGVDNQCGCDDGQLGPGETGVDCGGVCENGCGMGQRCSTNVDCDSQRACVDGVCCESHCADPCEACSTVYTGTGNGTCAPVMAGLDPRDDCIGVDVCNGDRGCMVP